MKTIRTTSANAAIVVSGKDTIYSGVDAVVDEVVVVVVVIGGSAPDGVVVGAVVVDEVGVLFSISTVHLLALLALSYVTTVML